MQAIPCLEEAMYREEKSLLVQEWHVKSAGRQGQLLKLGKLLWQKGGCSTVHR